MNYSNIKIRKASLKDLSKLYSLGLNTPEFKVSSIYPFMSRDEFKEAITSKSSIFLVAEKDNKILGFIHADMMDKDKPFKNRWACLVYIMTIQKARGQGIGKILYEKCKRILKKHNITHLYAWAHARGKTLNFFKQQGFKIGHEFIWVDRRL